MRRYLVLAPIEVSTYWKDSAVQRERCNEEIQTNKDDQKARPHHKTTTTKQAFRDNPHCRKHSNVILRRLTSAVVKVGHSGCKTKEIRGTLEPRQSKNENKWIRGPTIISAWALILLSNDSEKAHCQPTPSLVWPGSEGKNKKHQDGENEFMSCGEPSPHRPGSTRKRVEPKPPRRSVPQMDFAERRAQVRNNLHYSDVSSSKSDDIPGPSEIEQEGNIWRDDQPGRVT